MPLRRKGEIPEAGGRRGRRMLEAVPRCLRRTTLWTLSGCHWRAGACAHRIVEAPTLLTVESLQAQTRLLAPHHAPARHRARGHRFGSGPPPSPHHRRKALRNWRGRRHDSLRRGRGRRRHQSRSRSPCCRRRCQQGRRRWSRLGLQHRINAGRSSTSAAAAGGEPTALAGGLPAAGSRRAREQATRAVDAEPGLVLLDHLLLL
mmetsp:Transcript_107823/g.240551  ORF Transcript_107823/g.240551 Transcript_107823/m.240551 type:complete len:204 (-) Transcript_107823:503-1114(-)